MQHVPFRLWLISECIDIAHTKRHSMISLVSVVHLAISIKALCQRVFVQRVEVVGFTKGVNRQLPVHSMGVCGISLSNKLLEIPIREFRGKLSKQVINIQGAVRTRVHKQHAVLLLGRQCS